MGKKFTISPDGVFKLGDRPYQIPDRIPRRSVLSYRILVEPMQVVPRLKPLTPEQRITTRKYFLWRAAGCLIPSFRETDPKTLSMAQLNVLHGWIARHRPELLTN